MVSQTKNLVVVHVLMEESKNRTEINFKPTYFPVSFFCSFHGNLDVQKKKKNVNSYFLENT